MLTSPIALVLVCSQLLLSPLVSASAAPDARHASMRDSRPALVVLPFDTDRTGWMPPPQFGETASDLLAHELVESGGYRVLDREWLASAADAGRPVSMAEIRERARESGVDYLVVGSMTRFSTERSRRSGGGLGVILPMAGAVRSERTKSVVGLAIRVVDIRTGEVVATATADGRSERKNLSVGLLGILTAGRAGAGGYSSGSTGARDAQLAESLAGAVSAAARQIVAARARFGRPRLPEVGPVR